MSEWAYREYLRQQHRLAILQQHGPRELGRVLEGIRQRLEELTHELTPGEKADLGVYIPGQRAFVPAEALMRNT